MVVSLSGISGSHSPPFCCVFGVLSGDDSPPGSCCAASAICCPAFFNASAASCCFCPLDDAVCGSLDWGLLDCDGGAELCCGAEGGVEDGDDGCEGGDCDGVLGDDDGFEGAEGGDDDGGVELGGIVGGADDCC